MEMLERYDDTTSRDSHKLPVDEIVRDTPDPTL
jgi:hypothetical protein